MRMAFGGVVVAVDGAICVAAAVAAVAVDGVDIQRHVHVDDGTYDGASDVSFFGFSPVAGPNVCPNQRSNCLLSV